MASPNPLLIRGFLFILVWNSIQDMTCNKQSLPHHAFDKPAVSSMEFTKSDIVQFFLSVTPIGFGLVGRHTLMNNIVFLIEFIKDFRKILSTTI
jgi:hypothetical protein